MESGYGTQSYPYGWFDRQFYTDWRQADEALEQAGVDKWSTLQCLFEEAKKAYGAQLEAIRRLEGQLRNLRQRSEQYNRLTEALANVPNDVLEQLRTKLIAWIDHQDMSATVVQGLKTLTDRITSLETEISADEATHGRMLKDLADIGKVITRASQSSRREVPRRYYDAVVRGGSQFSSSGGVSHTTYYVDNSNASLTDLWLLNEVTGILSDRVGYGRGYNDGYSAGGDGYSSTRYSNNGSGSNNDSFGGSDFVDRSVGS